MLGKTLASAKARFASKKRLVVWDASPHVVVFGPGTPEPSSPTSAASSSSATSFSLPPPPPLPLPPPPPIGSSSPPPPPPPPGDLRQEQERDRDRSPSDSLSRSHADRESVSAHPNSSPSSRRAGRRSDAHAHRKHFFSEASVAHQQPPPQQPPSVDQYLSERFGDRVLLLEIGGTGTAQKRPPNSAGGGGHDSATPVASADRSRSVSAPLQHRSSRVAFQKISFQLSASMDTIMSLCVSARAWLQEDAESNVVAVWCDDELVRLKVVASLLVATEAFVSPARAFEHFLEMSRPSWFGFGWRSRSSAVAQHEASARRFVKDFGYTLKRNPKFTVPTLFLTDITIVKLPQLTPKGTRLMVTVVANGRFLYSSMLQGGGVKWVEASRDKSATHRISLRSKVHGEVAIKAYHIPEQMRTSSPRIQLFEATFHTAQLATSRPSVASVRSAARSFSSAGASARRRRASPLPKRSLKTVFPTRAKTMTMSSAALRRPPSPLGPRPRPVSASAATVSSSFAVRPVSRSLSSASTSESVSASNLTSTLDEHSHSPNLNVDKRKSSRTRSRLFLRAADAKSLPRHDDVIAAARHSSRSLSKSPPGAGSLSKSPGAGSLSKSPAAVAANRARDDGLLSFGVDFEQECGGQPLVASSMDPRLLKASVSKLGDFSTRSDGMSIFEESSLNSVALPDELSRQARLGACICSRKPLPERHSLTFTRDDFDAAVHRDHNSSGGGCGPYHEKFAVTLGFEEALRSVPDDESDLLSGSRGNFTDEKVCGGETGTESLTRGGCHSCECKAHPACRSLSLGLGAAHRSTSSAYSYPPGQPPPPSTPPPARHVHFHREHSERFASSVPSSLCNQRKCHCSLQAGGSIPSSGSPGSNLNAEHVSRASGRCASQATGSGGCSSQAAASGGCASEATGSGGCALQAADSGGCASQAADSGGHESQATSSDGHLSQGDTTSSITTPEDAGSIPSSPPRETPSLSEVPRLDVSTPSVSEVPRLDVSTSSVSEVPRVDVSTPSVSEVPRLDVSTPSTSEVPRRSAFSPLGSLVSFFSEIARPRNDNGDVAQDDEEDGAAAEEEEEDDLGLDKVHSLLFGDGDGENGEGENARGDDNKDGEDGDGDGEDGVPTSSSSSPRSLTSEEQQMEDDAALARRLQAEWSQIAGLPDPGVRPPPPPRNPHLEAYEHLRRSLEYAGLLDLEPAEVAQSYERAHARSLSSSATSSSSSSSSLPSSLASSSSVVTRSRGVSSATTQSSEEDRDNNSSSGGRLLPSFGGIFSTLSRVFYSNDNRPGRNRASSTSSSSSIPRPPPPPPPGASPSLPQPPQPQPPMLGSGLAASRSASISVEANTRRPLTNGIGEDLGLASIAGVDAPSPLGINAGVDRSSPLGLASIAGVDAPSPLGINAGVDRSSPLGLASIAGLGAPTSLGLASNTGVGARSPLGLEAFLSSGAIDSLPSTPRADDSGTERDGGLPPPTTSSSRVPPTSSSRAFADDSKESKTAPDFESAPTASGVPSAGAAAAAAQGDPSPTSRSGSSLLRRRSGGSRSSRAERRSRRRRRRRRHESEMMRSLRRAQRHLPSHLNPNETSDYESMLALQEYMGATAPNAGTPKRLVHALPSFKLTEASKYVSESMECQICRQEFEADETLRTLPCFHAYHRTCIDRWLDTSKKCPICHLRIDEPFRALLDTHQRRRRKAKKTVSTDGGQGEEEKARDDEEKFGDVTNHPATSSSSSSSASQDASSASSSHSSSVSAQLSNDVERKQKREECEEGEEKMPDASFSCSVSSSSSSTSPSSASCQLPSSSSFVSRSASSSSSSSSSSASVSSFSSSSNCVRADAEDDSKRKLREDEEKVLDGEPSPSATSSSRSASSSSSSSSLSLSSASYSLSSSLSRCPAISTSSSQAFTDPSREAIPRSIPPLGSQT